MREKLKIEIRDLVKMIQEYRERQGLSQLQLAEQLDVTQATISRILAGQQLPRKDRLEKILKLIGEAQPASNFASQLEPKVTGEEDLIFNENYTNFFSKSDWSCFYASRQLGSVGGDVLLVKELSKKRRIGILVGDSVGHGYAAAYMSFALEFAYSTIASMMSPDLLSPDFFERALGLGIVKTGRAWRGEPSIELIQADLQTGTISIVNRGMPYPLLMEAEKCNFLTDHRASAFSLESYSFTDGSQEIKLEAGQSILFYTDGLLDLLQESDLSNIMQRQNKLFRGDARAIGRNLIRALKKSHKEKNIADDVSFLILSRARKGRSNAL